MPTSEKINILVATDDNYAPYCTVMLTSLLENNKNESINIHLMTAGLSEKNECKIRDITERRYNQKLFIQRLEESDFKDFPIRAGDHVTLATYFRLICADILPIDIDKILYLDCDIIVRDSIRELWNYDIHEFGLAATLDPSWTQGNKYERLGIDPDDGYFCSGVMLINLEYWREIDIKNLSIKILGKMKDKLLLHDQDIVNVIFAKKWKKISYIWDYCCLDDFSFGSEKEFINDLKKTSKYYPIIIHFAGLKPWNVRGYYLYQCEFDYYYNLAYGKKNQTKYRLRIKLKKICKKLIGKSDWRDKYL